MSRAKGRIAASTILDFTVSYPVTLPPEVRLGGLVISAASNGRSVLGMVENIIIGTDPFAARMLARDIPETVVADLQQRQGNVMVRCLVVGYEQDGAYYRIAAPQPSPLGCKVDALPDEQVLRFCASPDYLTAVFNAALTIPLSQLLASHSVQVREAEGVEGGQPVLLGIMGFIGETFKRRPEEFKAIENALVAAGFGDDG